MVRASISNLLGIALVVIVGCSLSVYGKYGGGIGTEEDPYLIYTSEQMNEIGLSVNRGDWGKHFKLMADIDLGAYTGTEFNIIGDIHYDGGWVGTAFTGVFDGNGHTISNFTYDSNDRRYIGLFGYVDDRKGTAVIKNLGLIDANIDAGTGSHVGSLVGCSLLGTISGCYVNGGSVSGNNHVGGLVGTIGFEFIPAPSTPPIKWVTNCYAIVNVTGDGNSIGGLIGHNYYLGISDCYAAGNTVSSGNDVGGLVGYNSRGIVINCFSASSVEGENNVGGLVGLGSVKINNCYSTGSIVGDAHVGGLVGWNSCHPGYCGTIKNSYWDIESSGEPNMCGEQYTGASGCDPNYGKTTSQLHKQSTFTDWDFINVWNIGENQIYPHLRTFFAGDINKDGIVNFLDFCIVANKWMEQQ
jgi:hypothetical protein